METMARGRVPGEGLDLLLVDDEVSALAHARGLLKTVGDCRTAASAEGAIEAIKQRLPDLILLDLELPGMSGLELCRLLRSRARTRQVPIVVATGHTDRSRQAEALLAGASDFISKPLNGPLLRSRVQACLRPFLDPGAGRAPEWTDAETGLGNLKALDAELRREWIRAMHMRVPMVLLLIEVDAWSRQREAPPRIGQQSLMAQLAPLVGPLAQAPGDVACRHERAKFAVVVRDAAAIKGEALARRIIKAVQALGMWLPGVEPPRRVSVSCGVCVFEGGAVADPMGKYALVKGLDHAELLMGAESALAHARAHGPGSARLLSVGADAGAEPTPRPIATDG